MASTGDIDITAEGLDALQSFGTNYHPIANLTGAADAIVAGSEALPSGDLPEGSLFRSTANTAAAEIKQFATNVELGFDAFKYGAQKMAESFNAADQQMAWTMADVTTSPGEPAI